MQWYKFMHGQPFGWHANDKISDLTTDGKSPYHDVNFWVAQ